MRVPRARFPPTISISFTRSLAARCCPGTSQWQRPTKGNAVAASGFKCGRLRRHKTRRACDELMALAMDPLPESELRRSSGRSRWGPLGAFPHRRASASARAESVLVALCLRSSTSRPGRELQSLTTAATTMQQRQQCARLAASKPARIIEKRSPDELTARNFQASPRGASFASSRAPVEFPALSISGSVGGPAQCQAIGRPIWLSESLSISLTQPIRPERPRHRRNGSSSGPARTRPKLASPGI